ncbi:hypothetical protein QTP88_022225 [Uroleucon formosanum]
MYYLCSRWQAARYILTPGAAIAVMCFKMKTKFDTIIKNSTTERNNSTFLLKEKYHFLISEVKRIKRGKKESSRDYWLVQRYNVIEVQAV